MASASVLLLLLAGVLKPPAVNSINGKELLFFSNPMKLVKLDNGKSICFLFPSNVSFPLITRSANPTGMANVGSSVDFDDTVFFSSPSPLSGVLVALSSSISSGKAVGSKSGTNPTATQNDLGANDVDGLLVVFDEAVRLFSAGISEGRNSASNANEFVRLTYCLLLSF